MKYREKPQTDLCNELDDHRDSQRSHLRVSEMTFKYENKSQKVNKKQKYCYVSMEYNSAGPGLLFQPSPIVLGFYVPGGSPLVRLNSGPPLDLAH